MAKVQYAFASIEHMLTGVSQLLGTNLSFVPQQSL
jgi:hypothetical protein